MKLVKHHIKFLLSTFSVDFHLFPETLPFYPKMAKHAHREQVFGSFFVDFVIIWVHRDFYRFLRKIWEDNLGKCF